MENASNPAERRSANLAAVEASPYERYGRYFLIERIGRGGMAEVFRAVAQGVEGFRRVFVIKRIRPEKSDSVELVKMFCDEARLSALLHHPNIVQVYDFGQISGTYFLAMEYLRGKDLAGVMRVMRQAKSAVGPSIAANIALQVATGLHYAHALTHMDGQALRVVHRDVTPSNIMLQRTGAVKVLDFGIAQATNLARQTETGGGRVKGKLAYLSPEQVRLQPLDGRSDVFALGVVLWEMLCGRRLFPGENEFLTMRNVLTQPVPPPSSIRPDVPPALDVIVARALDRDRESRYPTARAMADELETFLQTAPCHSQEIPRLLQELFGEESTDQTPELPDVDDLYSGHISGSTSASLARASNAEAAAEAVLELDPDPDDSPPPPPPPRGSPLDEPSVLLPARSHLARRLVAATAAATLLGCLGWAVWRGRHPSVPASPSFAGPAQSGAALVAERPPAEVAERPPVAATPPAPADESDSEAADPPAVEPGPGAEAAPAVPIKAARRRPVRRISNDVTIDPFKAQ